MNDLEQTAFQNWKENNYESLKEDFLATDDRYNTVEGVEGEFDSFCKALWQDYRDKEVERWEAIMWREYFENEGVEEMPLVA